MRGTGLVLLLAFVLLFALACGEPEPEPCEPVHVPPDDATEAARPDPERASFFFPGNNLMQREFVFVHEDGSYDYIERWNFGVPPKEAFLALDLRGRIAKWVSLADDGESGAEDGGVALEGGWDDELQETFGYDWKVGCRMHVCELDGVVCCHQKCQDGGDAGAAYEPPDQFECMNSKAGGRYDWFLEGLHEGGMTELAACR